MRTALSIALLACLLSCACASPSTDTHPLLDMASFEAWHAHITPQPSELAWASLPWRTSYAEGLAAAQEQRLPLLLWVMNGHPLGCT